MEDTLLLVFIGLVAVALIVIAAGIALVAWYLSKFIDELTTVTRRLHEAGEAAASDINALREGIKAGGSQFIYQITKKLWPKKTTPRKSPPPQE